jgi:uncharacterized phage-associated protein
MAMVLDVAAYILSKQGPMTAMKLQKLCYYAQAWSLVWDEKPLFRAHIEAWANGPVIQKLYDAHRGRFKVMAGLIAGDKSALTREERATVDAVLKHYGSKSSQWLSELTHRERPWKDARRGLSPSDRSRVEITHAAMAEYYGAL